VTEQRVVLDLNEAGVAVDLPRLDHAQDEVQGVPYRPVDFRDDNLPTALERAASWLRKAEDWLGEPVDVIAIHLDYDDSDNSPYYEVKLLCNDEDLAGAPIAVREQRQRRASP
jgi:endonuclease/exonuclease/phosphatase family metal-dependent hydrolase